MFASQELLGTEVAVLAAFPAILPSTPPIQLTELPSAFALGGTNKKAVGAMIATTRRQDIALTKRGVFMVRDVVQQ